MKRGNFAGNISPIPYYTVDQYLESTRECFYDASTVSFSIRPFTRSQYRFVNFLSSYIKYNDYTGFTNFNASTPSREFCTLVSSCNCVGFNPEEISTFAKANNANVTFHYENSSYELEFALNIEDQFKQQGLQINLMPFEFTLDSYNQLIQLIGSTDPAQHIHLSINPSEDDQFCSKFDTLGFAHQVYNMNFFIPGFDSGFAICPSNYLLAQKLQQVLDQMVADKTSCQLIIKNGECIDQTVPFIYDSNHPCFSLLPNCPTTKKKTFEHNKTAYLELIKKQFI